MTRPRALAAADFSLIMQVWDEVTAPPVTTAGSLRGALSAQAASERSACTAGPTATCGGRAEDAPAPRRRLLQPQDRAAPPQDARRAGARRTPGLGLSPRPILRSAADCSDRVTRHRRVGLRSHCSGLSPSQPGQSRPPQSVFACARQPVGWATGRRETGRRRGGGLEGAAAGRGSRLRVQHGVVTDVHVHQREHGEEQRERDPDR